MKKYIPIHKKTRQRYEPVTQAEREKDWGRPPYSTSFVFEEIEVADVAPARPPEEAKKKAENDPAKES